MGDGYGGWVYIIPEAVAHALCCQPDQNKILETVLNW
jgi:hypothetical protein